MAAKIYLDQGQWILDGFRIINMDGGLAIKNGSITVSSGGKTTTVEDDYIDTSAYKVSGTAGVSGTFTVVTRAAVTSHLANVIASITVYYRTITFTNGIITSISDEASYTIT
jgi:hypothetical protein